MDYSKDVSIDPNNLDIEFLRQADLTLRYGNELAEAKYKTDLAKETLDVEYAKAFQEALDAVVKPVDAVKAAADINPKYTKARHDLNLAKYEQNLVQAGYDAIQTKKSALENLRHLQLSELYSVPKEPKEFGKKSDYREAAAERLRSRTTEAARKVSERRSLNQQERK